MAVWDLVKKGYWNTGRNTRGCEIWKKGNETIYFNRKKDIVYTDPDEIEVAPTRREKIARQEVDVHWS